MNRKPGLQTDIKCPFFRAFGGGDTKAGTAIQMAPRKIICESPVPTAHSTSIYFDTRSMWYSHVLWCCNQEDGGGCPIYRANMEKYEDKPDE